MAAACALVKMTLATVHTRRDRLWGRGTRTLSATPSADSGKGEKQSISGDEATNLSCQRFRLNACQWSELNFTDD